MNLHMLNKTLCLLVALFALQLSGCLELKEPPETSDYRVLGPDQTDL